VIPTRAWATALLGLALVACQRKAPGPEECQRFALQVMGVASTETRIPPSVKHAVDELTVTCLTRPFNRALLRCVEEGVAVRACMATYAPRSELSRPPPSERVFEPEF
jgi:hypothetical protein